MIISAWAPPMTGGSPTLIAKFLRRFPKDSYVIFTNKRSLFSGAMSGEWLPAKYYFDGQKESESSFHKLPLVTPHTPLVAPVIKKTYWEFRRLIRRLLTPLYEVKEVISRIRLLKKQALEIIATEKPEIILGTSDDGIFLIASYLAAKSSQKTFYVHLLDLYARNNYSLLKRFLARCYEPKILGYATKVFVTNSKTQKFYEKLYGISPIVVPHITKLTKKISAKAASKHPIIAYTGSVYWAQLDAVANLVSAIQEIPKLKFIIYSTITKEQLSRMGVWNDQMEIRFAKDSDIQKAQSGADILLLPMGFKTKAQDIVRTAAPGKMPEYMGSGVPVLVHAAPDDYIAEYAKKDGWGLVVDKKDPHLLAQAISRLLTDNNLRRRLVDRAFEATRKHHDQSKVIPFYMEHFQ